MAAFEAVHEGVGYALLALAVVAPAAGLLLVKLALLVRGRRARRLILKRPGGGAAPARAAGAASAAEPHFCGSFRLAVAQGDLELVAKMSRMWEDMGLDAAALLCTAAHGEGESFAPLHIAAVEGHCEIIEWLLRRRGVDVDALHLQDGGGRGRTALHYAVLNNHGTPRIQPVPGDGAPRGRPRRATALTSDDVARLRAQSPAPAC